MSLYLLQFLLLSFVACSSSAEKPEQELKENSSGSINMDFSGRYQLTIGGETYELTNMTRNGSRVSFQKKGIAVLVAHPEGLGKVAEVTVLSPEMYNRNSHKYVNEGGKWKEETSENNSQKQDIRAIRAYSFKFLRLDKAGQEEYVELDRGTVTMEYDDETADFTLTFKGKDLSSPHDDKETIEFSGELVLRGAYLMDRRD